MAALVPLPYEVEYDDVVYARPEGVELLARVYRPSDASPGDRPALVDVHGGAWRYFDRKIDTYYNRALAARGMVVVALDFRQAPDHQWPSAADDVATGVVWVREHAGELGVRTDDIGIVGGSSGGHLALVAGITRPLGHLCARALPGVRTRLALPLRARPHRQPAAFERAALRPGASLPRPGGVLRRRSDDGAGERAPHGGSR